MISLITPCMPGPGAQYLKLAADSVQKLRSMVEVEWIVAIDGEHFELPSEVDCSIVLHRHEGAAAARNAALSLATADYVFPLDADDEINADGIMRGLALMDDNVGWVAGNRVTTEGERTVHWHGEHDWKLGELAENWTFPFPFQPNTTIMRRELIWEAGGWPALPAGQDLGLALLMGELSPGVSISNVMTRYRVWPGQTVQSRNYRRQQQMIMPQLELLVNARRNRAGRLPCAAPELGTVNSVTPLNTR